MGARMRCVKVLLWGILFVAFLSFRVSGASFSKKAPEVAIKTGKTAVRFTMKKRSDLTGFAVYQSSSPQGNFEMVSSGADRVVRIYGLRTGQTYYFRIRGYVETGKSKKYTKYTEVFPIQVNLPGKMSLLHFLKVSMMPVGECMYVWGGGWNAADTGPGIEAVTIGVSKRWKEFFLAQDASYDYENTRYQIHDGLDCSGFVGWALYNGLNVVSGKKGFVMYAKDFAYSLYSWGWGSYTMRLDVDDYKPGDIFCNEGHVWICLGSCKDGSVVVLHSSPPGVRLCGTPSSSGKKNSQAVKLAKKYMKKYHPKWYRRYPDCTVSSAYLTSYERFRFETAGYSVCTDEEGISSLSAQEVLALLAP